MKNTSYEIKNNQIFIRLCGRIDSNNNKEIEEEIKSIISEEAPMPLIFDAKELEYISSAGLRIFLRLKKENENLSIINVNSDVYEIFDMTGFTQIMNIEKAYRVITVDGCEEIGRGANGKVYRIDQDNVVKVYNNPDALDEIKNEREVARKALVLGIPTAISYDVVKVGESYGSVFELLNAQSFSQILDSEKDKMDWCVDEYVKLLKKIHSTKVPDGELPDIRESVKDWIAFLEEYLPKEAYIKLNKLIEDVPYDNHMLHGDFHTKNVEYVDGEVMIIDMDTLSVGHPVFEFAMMYNAFLGYNEYCHEDLKDFLGIDYETSEIFWNKVLAKYFETANSEKIKEVIEKANIISYVRMIRRHIRQNVHITDKGKVEVDGWTKKLIECLNNTETLLFDIDLIKD
ncbi:MAG: STAS domain-containing protein [Lachnospiraceae bacterium]|nr:STAS domain-containing protein [Lachnospiraceae bacterium]